MVAAMISAGVAVAATAGGPAPRRQPPPARAPQAAAARAVPATSASMQPASKPTAAATGTPSAQPSVTASSSPAAVRRAARHRQAYLIYDSATPAAIPAGRLVATYADGPHPTPLSQVTGRTGVLWIDIEGTDPAAAAIDVEPGCASPSTAAAWAKAKLEADPHTKAVIYTMISEWAAVRAQVAALPAWMQLRVRWWIADPTGYPHVVPGSQATQWYWGPHYDISTAEPDF
jgi:hypothetical protein